MPKSKRNKQVELAKTKKHGIENKKGLFEKVRNCVDTYANLFVFSVNDMRNAKMKNVREEWKHSRFFIGKNKVMSMALGRFPEEEYRPNLHKISEELKGQRGLLFSNQSLDEVLSWFRSYSEEDYARSGNTATENVSLYEGPLPQFPHNLEPYLRQLGLPTSLVKGVVHLIKDHEVCKVGDKLTPETAKILKLLGFTMSEFHIKIECVWSTDGTFMNFASNSITPDMKDVKGKMKQSLKSTDVAENEIEEQIANSLQDAVKINVIVSNPPENVSSDSESEEEKENTDDVGNLNNKDKKSEFVSLNSNVIDVKPCESSSQGKVDSNVIDIEPYESLHQDKLSEKEDANQMDVDEIIEETISISESKYIASPPKERNSGSKQNSQSTEGSSPKIKALFKNIVEVIDVEAAEKENEEEIVEKENEEEIVEKENEEEIVVLEENISATDDVTIVEQSEMKAKDNSVKFSSSSDNEKIINTVEKNTRKSRAQKRKGNTEERVNEVPKGDEEEDSAKKQKVSRPTRHLRKTVTDKKIEKKTPLKKKTDYANSSQDSPLFRELRNRSVKVNKKKTK